MVEIEIGHCYYWILKQSRHDFFHDYYWILNSQDMIRILNGQDMISQVNIMLWVLYGYYVILMCGGQNSTEGHIVL